MLGLLAFFQTLRHRRLIVFFEQVVVKIKRSLMVAG